MYTQCYFVEVDKENIATLKKEKIILPALNHHEILIKLTSSLFQPENLIENKGIGIYSASQEVAGIVERVGSFVQKFKPKDFVIAINTNSEKYSGLSQYFITEEDFAYSCTLQYSEIAVSLLHDFMNAKLTFYRIPEFPRPQIFLILNCPNPLSHVYTHIAKQKGSKIILHTSKRKEIYDLKERYKDVVVLDDKIRGFQASVIHETLGMGVNVIIDTLSPSIGRNSDETKILTAHEMASVISIGGTIITSSFETYNDSKVLNILQSKSACVIFQNIQSIIHSGTFLEKGQDISNELMTQISQNGLRPTICQPIKFSEVEIMINSENMETLALNHRVVIEY